MIFKPEDILWVRNVKANKGNSWAYFNNEEDEILVHWSSSYKNQPTHAMKPNIGDIVVLFQKVNETGQIHLTHLVTPIDNIEVDDIKNSPKHRWARRMKVLARTKYNFVDPLFNMRDVNQGHSYSISLLNKNQDKTIIQNSIWNSFQPFFNKAIADEFYPHVDTSLLNEDPEDYQTPEGRSLIIKHKIRERDPKLIRIKKESAWRANKLHCECCKFNFATTYPNHGHNFIECHHRNPINNGERISSTDELALVCSNCHSMLHRKNKVGEYYSVEGLQEIITK